MSFRTCLEEYLVPLDTRTADGSFTDYTIDVRGFKEALFFVYVTLVSGTDPVLYVDVLSRDPVGGGFARIASSDAITAAGTYAFPVTCCLGKEVAVGWRISGTSPSFKFAVGAVFKS